MKKTRCYANGERPLFIKWQSFGISSTTNNPFRFTISYLGKGIKKRIGISFSQLKDLLVGKKKLGRTFYLHLNKKIYMNSEIRDYAFLKVKKKTRKPIKTFHCLNIIPK